MVFLGACLKISIYIWQSAQRLEESIEGRKTSDELDSIDSILLNNLSIMFLVQLPSLDKYSWRWHMVKL